MSHFATAIARLQLQMHVLRLQMVHLRAQMPCSQLQMHDYVAADVSVAAANACLQPQVHALLLQVSHSQLQIARAARATWPARAGSSASSPLGPEVCSHHRKEYASFKRSGHNAKGPSNVSPLLLWKGRCGERG
eukprot:gene8387-biopygen13666